MTRRNRTTIFVFACTATLSACQQAPTAATPESARHSASARRAPNTVQLDGGLAAAAQAVSTKRDNDVELTVASGTNEYAVSVALLNTRAEADKTEGSLCIFDENASSESVRATLRSQLTAGAKTWTFKVTVDKNAAAAGTPSSKHLMSVRQGNDAPLVRIGPNNQGEGHWPVVTATSDGSVRAFTFQAAVFDASDPRGYRGGNVDVVIRLGTSASDPVAHMTCPLLDAVTATVAPST